jgi:tRNA(Ile)-lysidine synthase
MARYRMLGEIARNEGATRIVTAHTLDDQAETIVARLIAGSGVAGLAGMVTVTPLGDLSLVRPLLTVAKTRLVATCRQADIPFVRDPTNSDRTFLRGRLRGGLMPALEAEGLNATRLGRLGERMRRADEALHRITEAARAALGEPWQAEAFAGFPDEIRLRLLGGAIGAAATEGLVELGKLEALHARLATELPAGRFAATLAGAKVTLQDGVLTIVPAPARRDRTLADGRASREC